MGKLIYTVITSLLEGTRVNLELIDERRFGDGTVHLRDRTVT
jgi:hypothetical protein